MHTKLNRIVLAVLVCTGFAVPAGAVIITPTSVEATTWFNGTTTPGNVTNGSGLTAAGDVSTWTHAAHGSAVGMWHAGAGAGISGAAPVVSDQALTFDLGKNYDLTMAHIWQMNQNTVFGRGIDDFNIQVSYDNNASTWTTLSSETLAIATGAPAPTQSKTLAAERVRMVRFDIQSTHSAATNEYVGLSEVRFEGAVTVAPTGLTNVAFQQFSNTSGTAQGFSGSLNGAIDGVTNTYGVHSASNVGTQTWEIDLGGSVRLDNVNIFARSGIVERVDGATITFLDHAGATVSTSTVDINDGLQGRVYFAEPTLVRSIRIDHVNEYLNFNELQAFATNIAAGKTASQSTEGFGGVASNGVDGNNSTISHTNTGDLNPWWQVDLGAFYAVDSVIMHNRDDCCGDRLENIKVQLLAGDGVTVLAESGTLNPANVLTDPHSLGFDLHELFGGNKAGQYVRVLKTYDGADEWLSLGEVQVYGEKVVATTNAGAVYYNENGVQADEHMYTLANAAALFSQTSPSLLVGQAIDGSTAGGTGWGNGNTFADNTAVFETVEDIGHNGTAVLQFDMVFSSFADHGIGKFRLLATTADRDLFADGVHTGGQLGDPSIWTVLDDFVAFSAISGLELVGGAPDVDGWFEIDDTLNPASDAYMILLRTALSNITGFRLEIMKDADLTGGGPGLSNSNGNSVLTEFGVKIASIPAPAALPAGLIMIGALAARRRRLK